jgi:hypothetical protein
MKYIHKWSPTLRDLPIDLISRSRIARWSPVPLRLIVGYGFMAHGFAKLARAPDATESRTSQKRCLLLRRVAKLLPIVKRSKRSFGYSPMRRHLTHR